MLCYATGNLDCDVGSTPRLDRQAQPLPLASRLRRRRVRETPSDCSGIKAERLPCDLVEHGMLGRSACIGLGRSCAMTADERLNSLLCRASLLAPALVKRV